MADTADWLVDRVLPDVGVRQWVVTFPRWPHHRHGKQRSRRAGLVQMERCSRNCRTRTSSGASPHAFGRRVLTGGYRAGVAGELADLLSAADERLSMQRFETRTSEPYRTLLGDRSEELANKMRVS